MSLGKAVTPSSWVVNTSDPETLVTVIKKLSLDLKQSQEETKHAENQIACLVSLIKRSWHGDKTATTHLANIIGFSPPTNHGESNGYAQQSKVVQNWERLCLKVLDREYARLEHEIRMKQSVHLRNRELYMEEILSSHQDDMSRIPIHRKNSPQNVDTAGQFLHPQHQQQRAKSGTACRSSSANRLRQRRQLPKGPREVVKPAEVHVSDFFIQNGQTNGSSGTSNSMNKGITGLFQYSKENQTQRPESGQSALSYDDPNRYTQPKLFDTRQVFHQTGQRKARPVSAAIPRERGRLHTRPRSAGMQRPVEEKNTNVMEATKFWVKTTKTRPPVPRLNLEETRLRPGSASTFTVPREDKITYLQNPTAGGVQCGGQGSFSDTENKDNYVYAEEHQKPSITVRIRSAVKQPECINTFTEDEQKMADMEEEFRKTTLKLQRKLGIENSGLIY